MRTSMLALAFLAFAACNKDEDDTDTDVADTDAADTDTDAGDADTDVADTDPTVPVDTGTAPTEPTDPVLVGASGHWTGWCGEPVGDFEGDGMPLELRLVDDGAASITGEGTLAFEAGQPMDLAVVGGLVDGELRLGFQVKKGPDAGVVLPVIFAGVQAGDALTGALTMFPNGEYGYQPVSLQDCQLER